VDCKLEKLKMHEKWRRKLDYGNFNSHETELTLPFDWFPLVHGNGIRRDVIDTNSFTFTI